MADRILMMEHSVYSVISPEGCAAILWRSAENRGEAAKALKLTSTDLLGLGVADEVVPEPAGGAHTDWDAAAEALGSVLARHVAELRGMDAQERREARWRKFEAIGAWRESES